jgi:transposase
MIAVMLADAPHEPLQTYEAFLGPLRPWVLASVQLDPGAAAMHFHVALPKGESWVCPECLAPASVHDYARREWRHVDLFGMRSVVHGRVPRLSCLRHGTRRLQVSWAAPGSRFTRAFETLARDLARSTSVRAAAMRLGVSWEEARGIVRRQS